MRPQHRPPSPPSSPGAFDNRAYQHDESDPNHNDSFASNGPQQNGHTKEPNGETKTLEAVNLELINLTPKNGNAKKKDVEVDMNATNPYDEYFVPVNEHRKYMRGEKLYVTADKRGEKGGCKRPLCWTLLGLVVAAIVAIIVLAATGILFTGSPTPLEQYNASVNSARALGGIGHVHHDHGSDHQHQDHNEDHHSAEHDHSMETTEHQHGPEPQSDEAHEPSGLSEETGDFTMYVPRTVEGELKIDNEEFSSALQDPESNEYREFVTNFVHGIKGALFDRNHLDNGANEITVEVTQLRKGSIIVTYRVHWKPKMNIEPTEDLLNANKLEARLDDYLSKNNRMINVYHIAEDKITTRPVLDICQINKNGCEHECEFDEMTLDFTCTCPHGQILDMSNPKKCISLLDSETEQGKDFTVLTVDAKPMTTKIVPIEEKPTTEAATSHENTFDWKETHHMMPETTTENEPDVNFSHIFGHTNNNQEQSEITKPDSSEEHPTPEPEPKAEPEPKPEPEPKVEPEPKPEPEPTAEPEPSAEPEPAAEPEPRTTVEPTPEPTATAEPELEAKAEPEPTVEPEPSVKFGLESEPTLKPELDSEAESETEPKSQTEPTAEPKQESDPESEPEPEPEPGTTTNAPEPVALNPAFIVREKQRTMSTPEPEPTSEPEPSQTTTPKTSEINHTLDTFITHMHEISFDTEHDTSPVTEISSMSTAAGSTPQSSQEITENSEEKSILYTNKGKFAYKPNDESESTTRRISISEPNLINEPSYEPKPEIISILSAKQRTEKPSEATHTSESETPTTEISDWLEYHNLGKSDEHNQTDFEELLNNNVNKIMHESEQRSFKGFDDDFLYETTTAINTKSLFESESQDETKKDVTTPSTEITRRMEAVSKVTASILPVSVEIEEGEINKIEQTTTPIPTTTVEPETKQEAEKSLPDDEETEPEKGPMITSILEEVKSLDTNKSMPSEQTTTAEPEIVTQFSINKHYQETEEDKIIKVLENKPNNNETATEREREREPEEGMDITFDAINMLYNRSSKSIEKPPVRSDNTTQGIPATTEEIEAGESTVSTSTDSDWLSEAVTEINYNEAMNKMAKNEPTETIIHKVDEIMNHGLVKTDDFEPDYLNNMGSTGNKQESDEPLYGMAHDYDNEDSRFKRVNKEATTETPKIVATEATSEPADVKENKSEVPATTNVPIETTTVTEYIYKVAEKSSNVPQVTAMNNNETIADNSNSDVTTVTKEINDETTTVKNIEAEKPMDAAPAPVWEESDADKYLTVQELPKKMEQPVFEHPVMIDEVVVPSVVGTPTTIAPMDVIITNSTIIEPENNSETSTNTTQLNNLNVNIYEIPSHNGNNSMHLAKSANAQSAEYDDHETEMNPFLPEVENNKSLVKKLQEGHDLEPNNLTETQNENTEEHVSSPSEGTSNKDSLAVIGKEVEANIKNQEVVSSTPVAEEDTSFNELLLHVNSHENETNVTQPMNITDNDAATTPAIIDQMNSEVKISKPKESDPLPVSTFLLDTDDLVTKRESTTPANNIDIDVESASPTTSAPAANNEGDLSVVPIEEEKDLLNQHKSENIEELNDISDLPKSDKRTLDDSVINNEA